MEVGEMGKEGQKVKRKKKYCALLSNNNNNNHSKTNLAQIKKKTLLRW